ncbi:hypothetical protein ACFWHR_09625 [Leucobacter sp. NPDC058333]|uniref:hypothetical protein n=1 Tax=Leucobacter sp. NPDC058333 TaxID=3346450 RepID=UPI0036612C46
MAAVFVMLSASACADISAASSRAGELDAALRDACASGEIVPATSLISEKSDRMLVMPEGSYGYMVNGEQKVVEFNYTFSDNAPPAEMPAHGHIFDTESLSVIPRSKTPESLERKLKHRGPGLHSALSG